MLNMLNQEYLYLPREYLLQIYCFVLSAQRWQKISSDRKESPGEEDIEQTDAEEAVDDVEEETEDVADGIFLKLIIVLIVTNVSLSPCARWSCSD